MTPNPVQMLKEKILGNSLHADYAVGTAGVIDEPSPFPRINAQRASIQRQDYSIDAERALLITEAYQKFEGMPQILKVAKSLAHVLANCKIEIGDHQLVVGGTASPPNFCPIFPEFSFDWVEDELKNNPFRDRPHNRYKHTPEVDQQLLGIADYWRGQTVADRIMEQLSPEQLAGSTRGGLGVYSFDTFINAGIGHTIPNLPTLFQKGWSGIRDDVQRKLDELGGSETENVQQREFYQAQLIVLEATMEYQRRYATLANEQAQSADENRRDELLQIAQNCEWVASNPPRAFWEAIQLGIIATNNILIEANGHSVSLGRFDQLLYPFYRADLDSGRLTHDWAQELLESACLEVSEYLKLRDWATTQYNSGRQLGGMTATIGGVDEHGGDATNDLTHMMLEAIAHTQVGASWVILRVNERTSDKLRRRAVQVIKVGTGEPKLINDDVVIPAMLARGCSLKEARNYSVSGLSEPDVAGHEYSWHDAAYFSLPRVLELALNNGRPVDADEEDQNAGPATGSLADFDSIDQVMDAFRQQLAFWIERAATSIGVIAAAHRDRKPLPFLSCLIDDCIEQGKDVSAGGARYRFTGLQGVGLANVADSLAAIQHVVFDKKLASAETLMQALKDNWKGHAYLYTLINGHKVPHFGNDDDYADQLARRVADIWVDEVTKKANDYGGAFQPGLLSVSSNIPFGHQQAASADGRKAGEPLSSDVSPVHTISRSHAYKGITAMVNSVAKLDQETLTNGVPLSIRIAPSTLHGGSADDNLASLVRAYFRAGGMHLQISVIDRETLIAANKDPDKYRGLLVYVAGYSTLWRELSDDLKQEIIGRTEWSFDQNTDLTPP